LKHYVSVLMRVLRFQHPGEKVAPLDVAQDEHGKWRPVEQNDNGEWRFVVDAD
jgi:hypothetical protein